MPQLLDGNVIIGDILHEWSIAEYEQYERNWIWYLLMGTLGTVFVVYAVLSGNFLFALIIVLFSIILFMQSHQQPVILPFKIAEFGIVVNNRFYPYAELDSYYIVYNPPDVKMLFIETKSSVRPIVRVPLMDMNPNDVRQTLREFLPEDLEKEEEPFADMMARKWRIH